MSLDYLHHYRALTRPGYAVLVTGEWGSGKTHQVRKALDGPSTVYVTLYGEPSVESVHEAVLAASSPLRTDSANAVRHVQEAFGKVLGTVVASAGGGDTGKALVEATGRVLDPLLKRQLRRTLDESHLIVFDDLERSAIEPIALAGLINVYLEHHGCRVVALAAEEKLRPANLWREAREKLFGQTLRVEPQISAAFEVFFAESVKRTTAADVRSRRERGNAIRGAVEAVFRASGIASLRIARQVTHDVQRLVDTVAGQYLENDEAFLATARQLAAWSGEIRDGRIEREHFGELVTEAFRFGFSQTELDELDAETFPERADVKSFETAIRRYEERLGIDIHAGPLQLALLETMLFDGRYEADAIEASLAVHPLYATASTLPAWRVLWYHRSFSAAELDAAAVRLHTELESGTAADAGTLFHSLARLLWLAEEGLGGKPDVEETIAFARTSIDRWIERASRSEPDEDHHDALVDAVLLVDEEGYAGHAFWSPRSLDRSRLVELQEHLETRARSALGAVMPRRAKRLLERLSEDPASLVRTLSERPLTHTATGPPALLCHLDIDSLVTRWLALGPAEQFDLARAFSRQSEADMRLPGTDREWLGKLVQALRLRGEKAHGFEGHRLGQLAEIISPKRAER